MMVTFYSFGVDHRRQLCQLLIRSRLPHTLPQALLGDSDSPSQTSTPPGQPEAQGQTLSHPECLLPGQQPRCPWQGSGRAPTSRHGF